MRNFMFSYIPTSTKLLYTSNIIVIYKWYAISTDIKPYKTKLVLKFTYLTIEIHFYSGKRWKINGYNELLFQFHNNVIIHKL